MQHDMAIDNASGASVRADLNNALSALATKQSGASAPSPTYAHQDWADTSANRLKRRNAANSAWIDLGPIDGRGYPADTGADGVVELATRSELDARTDTARVPTLNLFDRGLGKQGSDIASAASIAIPDVGDYFAVTGTTEIGRAHV